MRTLSPLTLFICVMTTSVFSSEANTAGDCSNCTATYMKAVAAPNGKDANCTLLKVYLNCLEKNVTSAECILSRDNATAVKTAKCTPHLTKPCLCQQEFWGSALGGVKTCGPLNTYINCLTAAKDNGTCKTGVKASELKAKHLGIHTSLSCKTPDDGCKGQTCSGHGKCTLKATLPAKFFCDCNDGYRGDQCQNTGASKNISLLSLMATLLAANILRMNMT